MPHALKEPDPNAKRSFDGPESFDLDERCLSAVAFGSSNATPPLIPNPFGLNFYQIVQTPRHVMIFSELVHDARIIRSADGTCRPVFCSGSAIQSAAGANYSMSNSSRFPD